MKIGKSILISIIIVVLSSCNSATSSTQLSSIPTPDIGIDVQNGKYLNVIAPEGWNSFKNDDLISLDVQNISNNQIAADPDFGVRIFVLTDGQWIEVKNNMVYKKKPFILDPMRLAGAMISPELPDYSITTKLRVFVIGTLIENGEESEKVASYIDLTLNP